jgi:hypothetical protein
VRLDNTAELAAHLQAQLDETSARFQSYRSTTEVTIEQQQKRIEQLQNHDGSPSWTWDFWSSFFAWIAAGLVLALFVFLVIALIGKFDDWFIKR